jgi:hypothetical protein
MNTNTETWGNIELPGLSDEELFKKDWNRSAAMREVAKDPNSTYSKAMKIRYKDKQNLKNLKIGIEKREQDIEFQKKRQEGIDKRTNSEDWKNKNSEKNKLKWQDPEYRNIMASIPKTFRKPIVTPLGVFKSRKEAAIAHNVDGSRISLLIKIKPKEFYYIIHEEYIKLTGIDPTI